jgi:tripartite ATP-independent transporter DctM subunit
MALTILAVTFFGFLVLGVPVAFSIGLSALCTILYEGLPVAVIFQQMMSGMNIFSFLAIPFFVFSGELMLHGGIADKIVAAARTMVGHIRGGLGMSNVVACTLFGGVAGSPVADVSAMGAVMIPMMKREGYHADYAVNVTTHAALVGAVMPTSHNIIIYALAASGKASIGALILAGIVPALLLSVCNLAAAYFVAVKRGYPALQAATSEAMWRAISAAVPAPCCTDRSGWRREARRRRGAALSITAGRPTCRSRSTPLAVIASPSSGTGSPTGPSMTRHCASEGA